MPTRFLIVEDDPDIAALVALYLDKAGFVTERVVSGREALQAIAARVPGLLVLDLMLPHVDGLEVCRLLRANEATAAIPIIMLTARAEESERIVGLELGADDYLAKPFSPNELVARVRALLRRAQRGTPPTKTLAYGPIAVDTERHIVSSDGHDVTLTAKEFLLLEFFVTHAEVVVDRAAITAHVWDENHDPFTNVLEVLVRRLRRKIDDGYEPKLIHTLRGAGYRLGE